MSEQELSPQEVATPEERIQAAIQAVTGEPAVEESAEPVEPIEAQEEAEPVEVAADGGEKPANDDDDMPITPGEENIAESSRLASLARRERRAREQAKERESQLAQREKELEEKLKRAEELEGRIDGLKKQLRYDPISALKELGIEDGYSDVASALYDEELGDAAPPEHKSQREIRALRDRLAEIENAQKQKEETAKAAEEEKIILEAQQKYVASMDSYMKEKSDSLTYANALYSQSPEDAIQAMYNIARAVAMEDPNGPLPDPRQIAEVLNQNLEETLGPVVDALYAARHPKTEEITPVNKEPVRQQKTLRNSQSRRTTQQPPALTEEERVKRALQALTAG